MYKKLVRSITLYWLWGVILTVILSFATEYSSKIASTIRSIYTSIVQEIDIESIDPNLLDEYIIEKKYKLNITVTPASSNSPGFVYESLDPNIVTIDSNGFFTGLRTENFKTTGRIKVTSKYDKDFEEIISIDFVRKYPDKIELNPRVESIGSTRTAYLGLPIYMNYSITPSTGYTDKDFVVYYNEEFFEKTDKDTYIPIKTTSATDENKAWFKLVAGNGYESYIEMTIKEPLKEIENFNDIYLYVTALKGFIPIDQYNYSIKSSFAPHLYKDGKRVYSKILSVTSSNPSVAYTTNTNYVYCKGPGITDITVTLPNGFSVTKTIVVKNKMAFPEITKAIYDDEDNILVKHGVSNSYHLKYPSNVTYYKLKFEYDKSMLSISLKTSTDLIIKGLSVGKTVVKMYYDDGFTYMEKEFVIVIEENPNYNAIFQSNIGLLTTKVLGHMGVFFILSFFALNLVINLKSNNKIFDVLFLFTSGFIFACLTELIQLYLPNRDCNVRDLFVDMTGFFIGVLFFGIIRLLCILVKKSIKRQKKRALNK